MTLRCSKKIRWMSFTISVCICRHSPHYRIPTALIVNLRRFNSHSFGDDRRKGSRTVVHGPCGGQRFVQPEEIPEPSAIASAHGFSGDVMASSTNALRDSFNREVGRRQPEKLQMTLISGGPQSRQPRREGAAGERCFEGETAALARQL